MSSKSPNNQDVTLTCLEKIFATQQSQQGAIIKLNNQLDEIVGLLAKSQEKQSIEEWSESHQYDQSPNNRAHEEQGNFMIAKCIIGDIHLNTGMKKLKNFKQDHDAIKEVCIEVVEFSRKLNPIAFLNWLMSMEDCFEWYAMPKNIKVHFVKAKLKVTMCFFLFFVA